MVRSIFLLVLLLYSTTVFASNAEVIVSAHFIKMQIIENGKKTKSNMIVDLVVVSDGIRMGATWNDVFIMPDNFSGRTKTVLRADYYSTDNGGIQNLTIQGNVVSFYLNRSPDRKVKVICTKNKSNQYDIKGQSFYWSSLLKENFTEEWVVVDNITLPALEVY